MSGSYNCGMCDRLESVEIEGESMKHIKSIRYVYGSLHAFHRTSSQRRLELVHPLVGRESEKRASRTYIHFGSSEDV